jgi:Effector Associated Constant Component 1
MAVLTRALSADFGRLGVDSHPVRVDAEAGSRGDVIAVGQLALAFITSGAAVSLIQCLKAYVAREQTLRIRFKHPDGREIEVTSKNVGSRRTAKILGTIVLKS